MNGQPSKKLLPTRRTAYTLASEMPHNRVRKCSKSFDSSWRPPPTQHPIQDWPIRPRRFFPPGEGRKHRFDTVAQLKNPGSQQSETIWLILRHDPYWKSVETSNWIISWKERTDCHPGLGISRNGPTAVSS